MGRISGLYVGGIIKERRRRYIDRKDNEQAEIITYTLSDEGSKNYFVEDYAPQSYHDVGEQMLVPVYVKPYRKKNGDLSYTICIKKDFEGGRGEVF